MTNIYNKVYNGIMFFAMVMLMLTSCSKDNIEMPDPNIDFIQTAEVVFDGIAEGQQKTISFRSPKSWTAEIHQTGAWLKADVLQGDAGDALITLSPRNDNFSTTARMASLEVYVDGYQAYTINVQQKTASTSDIVIDGHIDNGVMTLNSDATGNIFSDTIFVSSTKQWQLSVDPSAEGILSFKTGTISSAEQNGESIIVTADYSKIQGTSLDAKFYIKTNEGTAVPVNVKALSSVEVFDKQYHTQGEVERTSYELVDTIQHGIYQTTFFVDSNIRWTITEKPSWVETSADWNSGALPSNINTDGTINKNRQHVTLRVKESEMSVDGKSCTINLVNTRGQILKSINLVFAGISSSFINSSLGFPATDFNGNGWALEAHRSSVEDSGPNNRRRISMDFMVTTATDYSSINDAPYHLLLVQSNNGIPVKTEHHWAILKMGDKTQQNKTSNGLYQKQIIIEANERGDADDNNGITSPSKPRAAFVYLVPRSVAFHNLWNNNGTLKSEYADDLVLMTQKNDPMADYHFALVGIENGSSIGSINPKGETKSFDVVAGSYNKCSYTIELQNADGSWSPTNECTLSSKLDDKDQPLSITLIFNENKTIYDPFTQETFGSDRRFRIVFSAFIDDNTGSKAIYTIYADQKLQK